MWRRSSSWMLVLIALLSTSAALEAQSEHYVATTTVAPIILSEVQLRNLEADILARIQRYRSDNGLGILTGDANVAAIARRHSEDMTRGRVGFGHDGFQGRVDALRKLMPETNAFAENVFELTSNMSNDLAGTVVAGWLKSPPHYKNIMGRYSITGIGLSQRSDGLILITEVFAGSNPY